MRVPGGLMYSALFLLLILSGCEMLSEDTHPLAPATLIYMAANNNLDYYAMLNIKQMEQAVYSGMDGEIFVFIDRNTGNPSHPYLMRIEKNSESEAISSPVLQVYPELNSCAPDILRRVIDDVKSYSARYNTELRRLVLWSHGTGWLPEGTPFNEIDDEETGGTEKILLSFGLDNDGANGEILYQKEMDIKDLSSALRNEHFDMLILDACFMGAIEVAYELRDVCDYLLVSPAEILSSGFPYGDIIYELTHNTADPLAIALKYFSYYSDQKGASQSAAISVIDTRYLRDLANEMAQVYDDYTSYRDEVAINELLQYDRTGSNYFFDFKDFIVNVSEKTGKDYGNLMYYYKKAVPNYLHTSKMFNSLDLTGTAGLSVYIPNTFITRNELHEYYKSLEWAQDSCVNFLFD
jgi:hypothetical protein